MRYFKSFDDLVVPKNGISIEKENDERKKIEKKEAEEELKKKLEDLKNPDRRTVGEWKKKQKVA